MSPWAALAAVILWVASVFGAYLFGDSNGKNAAKATQAAIDKTIADTRTAANLGAADAISKIKITNTTVQGKLRTVVQNNPVYRDCVNDSATMGLLNSALSGKAVGAGPAGSGGVP